MKRKHFIPFLLRKNNHLTIKKNVKKINASAIDRDRK